MRIRVKVCGITSERDALEAVYLGVDAVGFDFRRGAERMIAPREAERIGSKLPPFVTRVGIFADQPVSEIVEAADTARLGVVQLSGREPAAICARLPVPWYKAFRLMPGFPVEDLATYACTAYRLEFRASDEAHRRPLYDLARAAGRYGRIVAGGCCDPGLVPVMVDAVRPWAVDLVEEVEVSPGVKDIDRLEAIVRALRHEERQRERGV